jgi:hypothetical protein
VDGHCPVFGMTPVLTSTVRVPHWYFDHYSLSLLCGSCYPPIPPTSVLLEPMSRLAYCPVHGLMPLLLPSEVRALPGYYEYYPLALLCGLRPSPLSSLLSPSLLPLFGCRGFHCPADFR